MKKILEKLFPGLTERLPVLVGLLLGVYAFSGFFGFLYETGFYMINDGMLVRRGNCFGPWIQFYGWGGLMLLILCWRLKKHWWHVLLVSALSTGVLELVMGWMLYTFGNGFRSWDYNTEIWNWGNIGGFVCFRSVAVFAVSGLLLVYVIVPLFMKLSQRVSLKAFLLIMGIPAVLFLLDCLYNDILVNIFPWYGALAFWRDSGLYGKVAGLSSLKNGI